MRCLTIIGMRWWWCRLCCVIFKYPQHFFFLFGVWEVEQNESERREKFWIILGVDEHLKLIRYNRLGRTIISSTSLIASTFHHYAYAQTRERCSTTRFSPSSCRCAANITKSPQQPKRFQLQYYVGEKKLLDAHGEDAWKLSRTISLSPNGNTMNFNWITFFSNIRISLHLGERPPNMRASPEPQIGFFILRCCVFSLVLFSLPCIYAAILYNQQTNKPASLFFSRSSGSEQNSWAERIIEITFLYTLFLMDHTGSIRCELLRPHRRIFRSSYNKFLWRFSRREQCMREEFKQVKIYMISQVTRKKLD